MHISGVIAPDTELLDMISCSIWPELQAEVMVRLPLRLSMLATRRSCDAEGENVWKFLYLSECSAFLSIVSLAAPSCGKTVHGSLHRSGIASVYSSKFIAMGAILAFLHLADSAVALVLPHRHNIIYSRTVTLSGLPHLT